MKLYTEEEVIKSIELARLTLNNGCGLSLSTIFNDLTPIELPSDEEIEKLRDEHIPIDEEDMWSERFYFTIGAKAILDKIQGGNK